ncbi:MAG TPA: phosphate acyltransferase PlsX [Rhizomicrobium sp.]|nr:phosphate acyltransferase PlsX [Rhizomicrobium sp.]
MKQEFTVSVDAMSGDAGPEIVVAALTQTILRHPAVHYLLHGDQATLETLLAKQPKLAGRVEIRHAADRVRMDEKPGIALRRGRGSSMWRAIESVAKKEAEAVVSAGNTGALMAMSMYQLGLIEGIERPAIAAIFPTMRGHSVLLDVGANIGTDAEQLVDFAIMGEAFARVVFSLERPSVALLNVGSEEMKGNDSVRGAAQILGKTQLPMEFMGFVEGGDITEGKVDVVVTDGFTGNVALKTAEGTAKLVVEYLRTALRSSLLGKLGAFIASGALQVLRRKLDPRAANGGIFLGLNGVVVKCHGGTDAMGFASGLDMGIDMAKAGIVTRIVANRAGMKPAATETAVL